MKKLIAVLLTATVLLMSGCAEEPDTDKTEPSVAETKTLPKEYPGDRDISTPDTEFILSKELFETTAKENGKTGVLYAIYGTVESYSQDEKEGIAYIRMNTNHGDVIVYDMLFLYETDNNPEQSYSEAELKRMREYYPIPKTGEFILIYGEYADTSSYFGCPTFIYGGQQYFMNVVAATADITSGQVDFDFDQMTNETEGTTEIKKYPGEVAGDHIPVYSEVIPKEVFSTTGEENGLIGNLYMIAGAVEEYIENPDGTPFFIRVNTIEGDVIIADPVEMLRNDKESNTMLSNAGLDKMREYFPLPVVGEVCVFYAEYQGMSGVYNCPFFVYGTSSYMLDTVVEIAMMGDKYTIEQQNAGKTEAPPATEGVTTTPTTPQPTEPAATQPKETTPVATEPVATEPLGNTSKAIEKAKSYLRSVSLSRAGMIRQLEFEGFSNEDAVYGADHCGADWNEQAIKKAKSYLGSTAFSYSGLIGQLEFEGFTHAEAVYGADNSGADWNEQAKLKAASYLSHVSFTRDSLIHQLEFEGFTHAQAVYGVEANGL